MHEKRIVDAGMRDRMRATYDAMAEARDQRTYPAWKADVRESFLSVLHREGHVRLIEIGAGTGRDGVYFAENGLDVVCVDLSQEMVRLCEKKGLEAHVMDVVDLRFPSESFDAAYSFNAFLHIRDAELHAALREVRRILRPGGPFFLGLYGGFDREGVYEEDTYTPKRFFSFRTDSRLLGAVREVFDVISVDRVAVEDPDPRLHFQSLILRKRTAPCSRSTGRRDEVRTADRDVESS